MYVPHIHNRHFTREQIEELKEEINKTEYEKAREPLNNEIKELEKEIWDLKKKVNAYRDVFNDIVCSLDLDYIKLYIRTNPIEVQFGRISDIKLTQSNFEPITIPIKEQLRFSINQKVSELYKKDLFKEEI